MSVAMLQAWEAANIYNDRDLKDLRMLEQKTAERH